MNLVYGFDSKTKLVFLNFLSSCLKQFSRCLQSGTSTREAIFQAFVKWCINKRSNFPGVCKAVYQQEKQFSRCLLVHQQEIKSLNLLLFKLKVVYVSQLCVISSDLMSILSSSYFHKFSLQWFLNLNEIYHQPMQHQHEMIPLTIDNDARYPV